MRLWRQRVIALAGVTAISVAVWLYAAAQTVQTRVIAFEVEFDSGDPLRLTLSAPGPLHVSAEITGSRQAVIRASESLSGRTIRLLSGADGIPAQSGEHDVLLKDVLSISPLVAPLGVDIATVTPAVVRITIAPKDATTLPR